MSPVDFEHLVARLEPVADRHPLWCRTRVGLLAVLGYVYLFAILAGLGAATVGLLYLAKGAAAKLALGAIYLA